MHKGPLQIDAKNPQVQELKERLQRMNSYFQEEPEKGKGHSVPIALKELGFKDAFEISDLYLDLIPQSYKFYHSSPGVLIKLSSTMAMKKKISVYATRDLNGEFQIIIRSNVEGEDKYYRIDKVYRESSDNLDPCEPWDPIQALNTRLQYINEKFQQVLPFHLKKILEYDPSKYSQVFEIISENFSAIRSLKKGQSLKIEPHSRTSFSHPLHVIRAENGEYRILMETKSKKKPFLRLDTAEESVWQQEQGVFLDRQAVEFLERIKEAHASINRHGLPDKLFELISEDNLTNLQMFMLTHPDILSLLTNGQGFQLKKDLLRITRTLNIVRQPNGEYMLMLETKSKRRYGEKDSTQVIGKGSFGTVKPAWRIDLPTPEEWANKTTKATLFKNSQLDTAHHEALFSQHLIENQDYPQDEQAPINVSFLGEIYASEREIVTFEDLLEGKHQFKQSQYSPRAICDLSQALSKGGPKRILFSEKDKARITQNILESVALMHAQGKAHQDIKTQNILIYKDEEGYFAKLADFGLSNDPQSPNPVKASTTYGYESPEISKAYQDPQSDMYEYYHQKQYSLAQNINKQMRKSISKKETEQYSNAHIANDMWAVGIVLFQLEYREYPYINKPKNLQTIEKNPLLRGLLQVNRKQRISVREALEEFHKQAKVKGKKATYEKEVDMEGSSELEISPSIWSTEGSAKRITPIAYRQVFPASSPLEKQSGSFSQLTNESIDLDFLRYSRPSDRHSRVKEFIIELNKLCQDPILINLLLRTYNDIDIVMLKKEIDRSEFPELFKVLKETKHYFDKVSLSSTDDNFQKIQDEASAQLEAYLKDKETKYSP